jgi:hypothetical protein
MEVFSELVLSICSYLINCADDNFLIEWAINEISGKDCIFKTELEKQEFINIESEDIDPISDKYLNKTKDAVNYLSENLSIQISNFLIQRYDSDLNFIPFEENCVENKLLEILSEINNDIIVQQFILDINEDPEEEDKKLKEFRLKLQEKYNFKENIIIDIQNLFNKSLLLFQTIIMESLHNITDKL